MTADHPKKKPSKKDKVICISGMAGSGKSTVAKSIAEHYGLKYRSGGDALKAAAADMGYTMTDKGWWETDEGIRFVKERQKNPEIDRNVDRKLLSWARKGDIVLDSWAMPWLLEKGFKIWLEAKEDIRIQRISERDGLNLNDAKKFLRKREAATKALYKKLYGFRLGEDLEPFDLIVDVDKLSKEEVFDSLKDVIDNLVVGR